MNLYLHGLIYGYKPDFATSSIASGTIKFDFSNLSSPSNDVVNRSVIFGVLPEDASDGENRLTIDVDGMTFSSAAVYSFNSCLNTQYQTTVVRRINSGSDNIVESIPSGSSTIEVPFYDFKQEVLEDSEFTLPSYAYGSYYSYEFTIDSGYVSDIEVLVKETESDEYVKYDVQRVKYLSESSDEVVFFNKTSENTYVIDFGSGLHGKWIPGYYIKIILHKTEGAAGNFSKDVNCTINFPTQAVVVDTDKDNNTIGTFTINPADYITVIFSHASGGVDALSGENLRKALVAYIRSRDNFISEKDFYDIVEKYTTDFRVLHKKTTVQENIIYILRALRDEYQNPVSTLNINPNIFTDDSKIENIGYKVFTSGTLEVNNYFYLICAYDSFGNVITSGKISVTLMTDEHKSIQLQWDEVPAAVKYRIYYRTEDFQYYVDTTNTFILDDGTVKDGVKLDSSYTLPTETTISQCVFPEIEYEGVKYTSPFLYKYSDTYNMYIGYLFYPSLLVNFETLIQEKTLDSYEEIVSVIPPSLYINIIYNRESYITNINLKSYQDISEWMFKITINEMSVYNTTMEKIDENTFTYVYSDNYGILPEDIKIVIQCYYGGSTTPIFTAKTANVTQCYNLSDQLQFPIFMFTDSNKRYLIDLPCMRSDQFNGNEQYYLDQIYDFIVGFNFEENRMISDNLGFRFLNTSGIYSFALLKVVKQAGKLFKDLNWISSVTPKSIGTIPSSVPSNKDSWIIESDNYFDIYSTVLIKDDSNLYSTMDYGGDNFISSDKDVEVLPYQIIVEGDQRSLVKALDCVRIKGSNNNMDGCYRITSVYYDETEDKTGMLVFSPIPLSSNTGRVYYVDYEAWRPGGPDNIATWNLETESWVFTQVNPGDLVTTTDRFGSKTYRYTESYDYTTYGLILPLLLTITITINKDAVIRYGIDLEEARNQIKLEVAKYLQDYFTGTDISYYPSMLIEYIMNDRTGWVKHVQIKVTDSEKKELLDGLEMLPEEKIRENIAGSKMDMLNYTSCFIWWDVNNIIVNYIS